MSEPVTISRAAFERLHRAASDFNDDLISGMKEGTYERDPDNMARATLLGEALRETAVQLTPINAPECFDFNVEWRIEVSAPTPRAAAERAEEIHEEGRARCYNVATKDGWQEIDLNVGP